MLKEIYEQFLLDDSKLFDEMVENHLRELMNAKLDEDGK